MRGHTYKDSEKTKNTGYLCAWEGSHPGCPGKCCLLLGSQLTVSFRFSKTSLLAQGPAISSSEGGPGSSNMTTKLNFIRYFLTLFCIIIIIFQLKTRRSKACTFLPLRKWSRSFCFNCLFGAFLLASCDFLQFELLHIPLKIPKPGVFFVS